MTREEQLLGAEITEKQRLEEKEINALVFKTTNNLTEGEMDHIRTFWKLKGYKDRPAVIKFPSGEEKKIKWVGL